MERQRAAAGAGPLPADDTAFRPIHYLGNKSRYLDVIERVVDDLAPPGAAVCDLFAGTSVVTRRLAQTRPVLSADVQAYSGVLARALTAPDAMTATETAELLERATAWLSEALSRSDRLVEYEQDAMTASPADPAPLADVLEHGSFEDLGGGSAELEDAKRRAREVLDRTTSTITWYYGGVYFSYAQALQIDALRNAVRTIEVPTRRNTAVAALLGVSSDAVSTVGSHFAQPVQPRSRNGTLKQGWVASVRRRRAPSVLDGFSRWMRRYHELAPAPGVCTALQADFRDTLSLAGPELGVIYADPPYTRDHYSRFYHVLETIALDDDPGVSRVPGGAAPSRGLYRRDRHQSPFSIRTQVRPAFRELFAGAKCRGAPLVLSYSPMGEGTPARPETRLVSVDELVAIASEYFADVRLVDVEASTHSKFNKVEVNAAARDGVEVLLVATL